MTKSEPFKGIEVTVMKDKKAKKESKKKKKKNSSDEEEEEEEEKSNKKDVVLEIRYYSSDFNEKLFIQQFAFNSLEKCFNKNINQFQIFETNDEFEKFEDFVEKVENEFKSSPELFKQWEDPVEKNKKQDNEKKLFQIFE